MKKTYQSVRQASIVCGTRGCGGMPLDSPATFSAAYTGDAHFAADDLQRRFPGARLLLVGMLCAPLQTLGGRCCC